MRRARPLLGTRVEVAVRQDGGRPRPACDAAIDAALARVAAHHRAMSFHEPASDLAAIAAAATGDVVRVAPDTWRVLRAALDLEAESGGVFDVAVAGQAVARGLLPPPRSPHAPGSLARSARAALALDEPGLVRILAPVWIDLGGIAKGAAVDAAVDALREHGFAAGWVDAGGDLAVFGDATHAIRVPTPGSRRLVDVGTLNDGAIATSVFDTTPDGDAASPRPGPARSEDRDDVGSREGRVDASAGPAARRHGASIDVGDAPAAARHLRRAYDDAGDAVPPGRSRLIVPIAQAAWAARSTSVVAPRCGVADALTKVVAALGRDAAPLLARHGAFAFSVDGDGRIERVG